MPPKLPSFQRILSSSRRQSFICPSCRHTQLLYNSNGRVALSQSSPIPNDERFQRRAASTASSITAVNAKLNVPPAFHRLYTSLEELNRSAGSYFNTIQLRLALEGLKSEDPQILVAVLGLNGQAGARRLARALLADPLNVEAAWERQLTGADNNDNKAIILRYDEQFGINDRHPLFRVLSIPSPILKKHRLQIFIHAFSPADRPLNEDTTIFLDPGLEDPSSGRLSRITYPVHRAILYEEGLNSLATLATIQVHQEKRRERQMLKGVVDWSWSTSQQRNEDVQVVSPINLALAETAIETFRRSLDKSLDYEHLWFDAGMPPLSAWLLQDTVVQAGMIKPAIKNLVETILDVASRGIASEEVSVLQKQADAAIPPATKKIIHQGITIWAENAHTELRDRLNIGFYGKDWRKTKWWKLIWRVDDVGYIASDILQRGWLIDAEKEMIWISGRIHQSGLLGPPRLRPTALIDTGDEEQKLGGKPPAPSAADLIPQSSIFNEPSRAQQPWPQDIPRARSILASLTVPPLQALSQSLLLQTISTNILASSLSVLVYISISTTSPYESSAIAATGLVYSMRRLQKRWEVARDEWETAVREEGRRVLRNTEALAREAVEGAPPEVDEAGFQERAIAKEAIAKVHDALKNLEG